MHTEQVIRKGGSNSFAGLIVRDLGGPRLFRASLLFTHVIILLMNVTIIIVAIIIIIFLIIYYQFNEAIF